MAVPDLSVSVSSYLCFPGEPRGTIGPRKTMGKTMGTGKLAFFLSLLALTSSRLWRVSKNFEPYIRYEVFLLIKFLFLLEPTGTLKNPL